MKATERRKFSSFKINEKLTEKLKFYKESFLQSSKKDLKSEIESEHINNVDPKSID